MNNYVTINHNIAHFPSTIEIIPAITEIMEITSKLSSQKTVIDRAPASRQTAISHIVSLLFHFLT